jgi:hypothetical protein
MSEIPVVASFPVAFSTKELKYFLIPLSALYVDRNGVVQADRWPVYVQHPEYGGIINAVVAQLQSSGILAAGPAPQSKPAFSATAKTPGATGVDVEIAIANVAANAGNPPASTADVTVTETDTYTGVAADKLIDNVGSTANGGTRPGLVFVSSAPPAGFPAAGNYPMHPANPGDPATADIPLNAGGGNAFTLKTRDGGADAPNVAIQIKDLDVAHNVYTLIAKWNKSQNALAMTDLAAAFAYVVDIKAPAGGFLAPAEGATQLGGGSDAIAVNAVKASAVILSK